MTTERKVGPNRGNAGKGRPKGSVNKTTGAVKEMILAALDQAGGAEYLLTQSRENPTAFMTLVGKVLPMQVTGADGGPVETVARIELVGVSPDGNRTD